RGLANVAIQAYLTAAVINLKRLAAFLCLFFIWLRNKNRHRSDFGLMELIYSRVLLQWRKDFVISRIAA
ncbi:MAG: hypothetical protein ABIJ52_09425, partial [Pseudomonadota bacterium]